MHEVVGRREVALDRAQRIPLEQVGAVHRDDRIEAGSARIAHHSANRLAAPDKLTHEPAADVAGRSGDEHRHVRTLTGSCAGAGRGARAASVQRAARGSAARPVAGGAAVLAEADCGCVKRENDNVTKASTTQIAAANATFTIMRTVMVTVVSSISSRDAGYSAASAEASWLF